MASYPLPRNEGPNAPRHIPLAQLREMCLQRIDFLMFGVLHYQVTDFHSGMLGHQLRTPHSMVLAPRGGGKSTCCDVSYVIWRILKDPNIRICIASESAEQAQDFLGEIKSHFENNQDLLRLFGDMKGPKWNDSEIIVATRNKILKEPTITAVGAGGPIVGKHFDLIIGDDLVSMRNSMTPHQRNQLQNWFYRVLMPTLEPHGEVRIIGTRYDPMDLYGHLAKFDKKRGRYANQMIGPNVYCVPALTIDEKTGKEKSFWPEKFTLEYLQMVRENSGPINFSLQYQNDATIMQGTAIFRIEDIEPYCWTSELDIPPIDEMEIYIGVDPAISKKETADFFAIVVIGVTTAGHVYVLEYQKDRLDFAEQIHRILEVNSRYRNVIRICIESISYQQALAGELQKYAFTNIEEVRTHADKILRARALSALSAAHKLHLPVDAYDFIEQLSKFPDGDHDDLFDALDHAVSVARKFALYDYSVTVEPYNLFRR